RNYGWNRREGLHPFGFKAANPRPDLVEPIWEYHHDVGKSITGGAVYRGQAFPELVGLYLYADYVRGKIWALRYDGAKKRGRANRADPRPKAADHVLRRGRARRVIPADLLQLGPGHPPLRADRR